MSRIVMAVLFKSYRPKVDNTVSLVFDTQEVDSKQIAELHDMRNTYGVLYFKSENQLTEQEMKDFDEIELEYNGLSKSKRLKNVLYRVWEQQDSSIDEKEFYSNEMEKIINHYKNKLT